MNLVSPPALTLPKSTGQYKVAPDAFDGQLGCLLLPEQETRQLDSIGF